MSSDETDSLDLFMAGLKPLQAYSYKPLASNVSSVNTVGAASNSHF